MQLGASVDSVLSDAVTHVVSASNQTDKVHWARKRGCHVVSPGWLHAAGMSLCQCCTLVLNAWLKFCSEKAQHVHELGPLYPSMRAYPSYACFVCL